MPEGNTIQKIVSTNKDYGKREFNLLHKGNKPIIHWLIFREFVIAIVNNSIYPAFNIRIESIGEDELVSLEQPQRINNIQPYQNIALKARYQTMIEGTHIATDNLLSMELSNLLPNLKFRLTYEDEKRLTHTIIIEFIGDEIISTRIN